MTTEKGHSKPSPDKSPDKKEFPDRREKPATHPLKKPQVEALHP